MNRGDALQREHRAADEKRARKQSAQARQREAAADRERERQAEIRITQQRLREEFYARQSLQNDAGRCGNSAGA